VFLYRESAQVVDLFGGQTLAAPQTRVLPLHPEHGAQASQHPEQRPAPKSCHHHHRERQLEPAEIIIHPHRVRIKYREDRARRHDQQDNQDFQNTHCCPLSA